MSWNMSRQSWVVLEPVAGTYCAVGVSGQKLGQHVPPEQSQHVGRKALPTLVQNERSTAYTSPNCHYGYNHSQAA